VIHLSNKKKADEILRQTYSTYSEKIGRYCNIKLKNRSEADDCVQECFMIFYKAVLRGEKIENTGAFLYKIADNLIKTQWRQDKKRNNILSLDEISEAVAMPESIDSNDVDFDLYAERIINRLDEKEQTIYKLKYVEEKSIADISAELKISFDATAKRLSRLRQKVRQMISDEAKGDEIL
jgi:RNA polymerase sigma-70 factor (ECF subfamily)